MTYTVKYHAGSYSGTRTVNADDEEHAIAKVRAMIRKDMSLSMYSDSYKVISSEEDEND
jgi:hypothetical protein